MKQLFIFNTYSIAAAYGIGTYINELTNCICSESFEVNIVYLRANIPSFEIEVKDNIRYFNIPTSKYQKQNTQNRNNLCYSRSICQLLIPYIKSQNSTVFHLNFMGDEKLCKLLKQTFKCKVMITVHYAEWAFPLFGNKQRFKEIINKSPDDLNSVMEKNIYYGKSHTEEFLKSCDKIITIARHEVDTLHEVYNIDKEKTITINNGIKDSFNNTSANQKSNLRKEFLINKDEKVILFVGRLDKLKGFPILLKSFELALSKNPNIRLIAIGGGNINETLSSITKFWNKITFTGFLNKETLAKFYKLADIGIIPSMYEEFGYVAAEMMMHGLPIIANRTTGLAELIVENKTGLFIDANDDDAKIDLFSEQLCDKIIYLLENEKKRSLMSKYSRERFLKKYEIEVFKKNMLNLYQNI